MTAWAHELQLMQANGAVLAPGLSPAEFARAEQVCRVAFPPDLRALLAEALPLGDRLPNWRTLEGVAALLEWPFEGLAFDIEHNAFWWPEWGPRPADLRAALAVARKEIATAAALVPVWGHRYLPAEPLAEGNPVLSVYQADIIYYGRDLRTYLRCECGEVPYPDAVSGSIRRIRLWSALIDANSGAA